MSSKYELISCVNIEAQKLSSYEHLNDLVGWKVDIIFINSNDANLILKKNLPLHEIDKFFEKFAKIRVYTAGKEGSYLFTDNIYLSYPSVQLDEILDRTGAGDCYAAGFLKKLCELIEDKTRLINFYQKQNSENFKEILINCMEFATFTALYKISTQLIPTKKQIEDFIKKSKKM